MKQVLNFIEILKLLGDKTSEGLNINHNSTS